MSNFIRLTSILLFSFVSTFAQTDTIGKNRVYQFVENMPSFPGGEDSLLQFLSKHITYPTDARTQGQAGRVIVEFIVLANGQLTNIQIKKDIGGGCGQEVLRVLKLMPKWEAGQLDGQAVNVQYVLPVMFALEENKTESAPPTYLSPYLNYQRTRLIKKHLSVH